MNAIQNWGVGLFPDWSPLLPYMVDRTAHYAEKIGDTQQLQILEALNMKTKTPKINWNYFENSDNVLKCV